MNAAAILQRIRDLRVLVVGDICLDRWCRYDPQVAEPSRETGIPRLGVVRTEVTPGAAGTVAGNLIAMGAREVAVLGIIGDDGFGFELRRVLEETGIRSDLAVSSRDLPTFTYTKLINLETEVEDQPRVDFILTRPIPPEIDARIVSALRTAWGEFDVVIVSDQAETEAGGVISAAVRQALSELALSTPERIVWVDSRVRGEHFRNVLLKCNESEAASACTRAFGRQDLRALRERIGKAPLIVTRGEKGALIVEAGGEFTVETRPVENPVDICGAGDSFSAGSALALAAGAGVAGAVRFGNLVSSVTIMKKGTGTASPGELLRAEKFSAGALPQA